MFYRFSPELVLRSPWRPYRARPGERVLVLAAATTFPPSHPTTRLCLELLAATLAAAPGPRLLDVGCGSGVLLLAGVAAGARLGVGLDLSGKAAITTRNNARANGLADSVQVIRGSTECLRGKFGIILAAPDARLILSGFKDTQEGDLRDSYQRSGWVLGSRLTRDEWVIELPPEKSYTWVAWQLSRPPGIGR